LQKIKNLFNLIVKKIGLIIFFLFYAVRFYLCCKGLYLRFALCEQPYILLELFLWNRLNKPKIIFPYPSRNRLTLSSLDLESHQF